MVNRTVAAILRDAYRAGWRAERPQLRRHARHFWTDPDQQLRVGLRITPTPGTAVLRIDDKTTGDWTAIAICQVATWQAAVEILYAYGIIDLKHRLGVLSRHRRPGAT